MTHATTPHPDLGRGDDGSEQRLFRALMAHSAEAISVLDVRGTVRYANPAFCRAYGFGPEGAAGVSAFDLVHPDDAPAMIAKFQALAGTPGAVISAEYRVLHGNGAWRTRSTVATNLLADPAVGGIVLSSRDVTEQHRAARALKASENRYRQLVETSHEGICTVDAEAKITFANSRLADMLGYQSAELTGRSIFDFMEPDASIAARHRFTSRPAVTTDVQDVAFRRSDGATRWMRESSSAMLASDGSFRGAMYVLDDVTEGRRAEAALRDNEHRYRLLFERNPLPMYVVDTESRDFVAVNDAMVAHYGYAREEFLAMRLDDLRAPEDRAAFVAAFESASGYGRAGVFPHVRKDGSTIFAEIVSDAIVFGDRHARLVMAKDVTERHHADAALRQAHEMFTTLVDAAPLAIVTTDVNGDVRSWNATAERMFGWTAAEVVGCANPIVPAARRVEYARTIRDFGERGTGPSVIERSALCKDGTVIDVSLSTAPMRHADGTIGGVALITDITTRRRAEVALDEARRQTDLLLASTGEGVYAVDASGLTTFVNPAAARLLHSTPERLLGREMHALIHHSHADGTRFDPDESPINASIRDGTVHRVDSEVFWREDGTSFPVEYVSTPLAEDGRIIGAVVAFQDITQRRQLELQLRQGQKMEAIGRLAGGVAHDFNNLLTVITGYTVMLLTELPPEDPVLQDLREIQAASERGAGLTRQLLAFSRQQVLQPRVVDLKRVIGGMEKMLRRLIGEDIEFQIDAEGEPLYARADSGQIEQVLMNLVVNARDAMPTGGLLSMQLARARLTERDREQHSYVVPGEYACVSVRDTGCGMDNATQSRIFEPFFTTKESAKGTGLGLATVYGIVKQSGGYIWADSAPGQGTTFRVYLPEVHEEAAATVPAPAEELANGEAGATVLLVEDEDALRAVIERILRKRGYVVLAAASGAAALALVEQHAGPIDLLVTDVVMPKMSGQELAERLVQARGDLPVLFMSGYSLEAVAKHGVLRAGARLLKKPFTPQDLALVTGEVLSAHAGLVRTSELRAVRAAVD